MTRTTATESPSRDLDRVVLARDVPEAGLRAGDVGTVVWVYGAEAVEVEFVTHAGRTPARCGANGTSASTLTLRLERVRTR